MATSSETDRLFVRILEADGFELRALRAQEKLSGIHAAYSEVLSAYWSADLESLKNVMSKIRRHDLSASDLDALERIAVLRLEIRGRRVRPATVERVRELAQERSRWTGESWFLVAMGQSILGENAGAAQSFERAAKAYESQGARRKSNRARFNSVSLASSLGLSVKKTIAVYRSVATLARRQRDHSLVGSVWINLSREYQVLGAVGPALRYARMAQSLLERRGLDQAFYQASLQLADLLFESARNTEAEAALELCETAPYPDAVLAAQFLRFKFLEGKLPKEFLESSRSLLDLPFRKRLEAWTRVGPKGKSKQIVLTPQEGALLHLLSVRPLTRAEIASKIFGRGEGESLRKRVEFLLVRLRKKLPGSVVFSDGMYELAERD